MLFSEKFYQLISGNLLDMLTHNLEYPRIGNKKEIKKLLKVIGQGRLIIIS
jgi:hypothetical protein